MALDLVMALMEVVQMAEYSPDSVTLVMSADELLSMRCQLV